MRERQKMKRPFSLRESKKINRPHVGNSTLLSTTFCPNVRVREYSVPGRQKQKGLCAKDQSCVTLEIHRISEQVSFLDKSYRAITLSLSIKERDDTRRM